MFILKIGRTKEPQKILEKNMFFPENLETKNTYLKIPGASRQDRCSVRARNPSPHVANAGAALIIERPADTAAAWRRKIIRSPVSPGFFSPEEMFFWGGCFGVCGKKHFELFGCPFFFVWSLLNNIIPNQSKSYETIGAICQEGHCPIQINLHAMLDHQRFTPLQPLRWGCTRGASFGAGTKVSCRTATNRRAFVDGFGIY